MTKMGLYHNIEKTLNYLYRVTLCKIGAHRVAEFEDKFREGDELEDWYENQ